MSNQLITKVVKRKPRTAGLRGRIDVKSNVYKGAPEASLTVALKESGGRNSSGRKTVNRGPRAHRRKLRLIDWKRNEFDGIPGKLMRFEYDPNRSALIGLVRYDNGAKRYIILPKGLDIGATVLSGPDSPIAPGNCLALQDIPLGSVIHNIELKPGKGAQMIRSAGGSAQLKGKDGKYAIIQLRSGEMRKILLSCRACVGEVANSEHALARLGKAGANRWRGRRPSVRGVAMNPIDHPHGGGEGKTSGGRHPVSPTGVPAKGFKTRRNKRTAKLVVRDRRKK